MEAKRWRPEGWDSRKKVYEVLSTSDNIIGITASQRLVEAGADAMLEALKRNGVHVPANYSFLSTDFKRKLDGPGVIVIIPEE